MAQKNLSSLNFSNTKDEAVEMFNSALESIFKLALAEGDLKKATAELPENIKADKKAKAKALERERIARNNAKERGNALCLTTISRFISTADVISGNYFNFDVETFLRNVGALEGDVDKLKKSAIAKVERFRNSVVDRKTAAIVKRKTADYRLTYTDARDIKNTYIEVVLALADAFVDSGCFEYSKWQLVRVNFEK